MPSIMSSGSEEEQSILKRPQRRHGKNTIAVIAVSNLCAWCCISLIAPFFPIEAAKKGTSQTVIGFIYSSSELVIFLMSPIFGKLLSKLSPRFFYIAGLCVFGSCDVMFGWLNQSPSGIPFITICFAVRAVEAMGTASIMTASFAIAGNNFPDRIGTIYGIIQTMTVLGFLIGPAVGGGLYELGGFGLPFWVLGSCVFICGCVSCVVLPSQDCKEKSTAPSSLTLLRSPLVWFGSVCIVCTLIGFTIWSPMLAQHLEQFNLRQSVIGLIFIIPAATYSVTTPVWGLLLDRNLSPLPLMTAGLCLSAVVVLFIGPAPFLTSISPMLWLTIVALVLLGFFAAPVQLSGMRCVVQGARDLGFEDDSGTFGLVGGIVQSSHCLGTFVGPMMGGAVTEKLGFGWTMTICSGFLILPVLCFSPFLLYTAYKTFRGRSDTPKSDHMILNGNVPDVHAKYESSCHGDDIHTSSLN